MKSKELLMSLFAIFSDTNIGNEKADCGWRHDDQRVNRADKKRLRKNAARLKQSRRLDQ